MFPKFRFLLSSLSFLTACVAVSACGQDERIEAVSRAVFEDGGDGLVDPFADDDDAVADDDTDDPIGRPSTEPEPTPGPTVTSNMGLGCDSDADCGDGLICMQQSSDDFLAGGPPNGLCTAPCAGDFECQALDSNGICLSLTETEAFCLLACTPGDPVLGQTKCGGRLDTSCEPVDLGLGFCRPMCATDADCGDRFCDYGIGVCVDEPLEGDPIGGFCDPETGENQCASGSCLLLSETYATCSGDCRVGMVGCGSGNAMPEDPSEAICLALLPEAGLGDTGQCLQRCNCDLDCAHPDAACFAPFGDDDEAAVMAFGTIGICVNSDLGEGDPTVRIGIECDDDRPPMNDADSGPVTDSGPAPTEDAAPMSQPDDSGMSTLDDGGGDAG